jgi:hypothetical protein
MNLVDPTVGPDSGRPGLGRPRRGLIIGAGAAVLAVLAVGMMTSGGRLVGGGSHPAPTSTPHAEVVAVQKAFEPPSRRVVLPAGSEQVDEYPVRFPHTPQGAAAAAVAVSRYSASLDYAVVDEVLRLYAVSGQQAATAADQAAATAVSAGRNRLGVAMAGPAPSDASVFADPFGVQWSAASADEVTVSVLSAVEYRSGDRDDRQLVATASKWRWDTAAGDWRVEPDATNPAPAAAELGSVEFNQGGWAALAEQQP